MKPKSTEGKKIKKYIIQLISVTFNPSINILFGVYDGVKEIDRFYLPSNRQIVIEGDFKFYPKYSTSEYKEGTLEIINRDAFGNII